MAKVDQSAWDLEPPFPGAHKRIEKFWEAVLAHLRASGRDAETLDSAMARDMAGSEDARELRELVVWQFLTHHRAERPDDTIVNDGYWILRKRLEAAANNVRHLQPYDEDFVVIHEDVDSGRLWAVEKTLFGHYLKMLQDAVRTKKSRATKEMATTEVMRFLSEWQLLGPLFHLNRSAVPLIIQDAFVRLNTRTIGEYHIVRDKEGLTGTWEEGATEP